ncbi:MAG TPA: hypothetical protein VJ483_03160 [Holophagaceae bacterium]|nr:hypothetical protein [Holophagaceae bacterium]
MRSRFFSLSLLALSAVAPAAAGDLDQIVDVGKATWTSASVGVICDAEASRARIQELARLMGGGTLTVANLHRVEDVGRAAGALRRANPGFVVLFPDDRVVRDGSFAATATIHAMNSYAVPTLATSRAAIQQGATAAMGADTGNQLILNQDLKGTISIAPSGLHAGSGATAQIIYINEF